MIGDMLAKARKSKDISKTELARVTDINIGHLTHIEKGERNPSHKALKNICKALNIPYQPLMFTYDKELTEEQQSYDAINHISYNKIIAVDKISGFIDCPPSVPSAAIAIKVPDNSMEPTFAKNSYVYVELNTPLSSKDYGLFELNDKVIIRKFFSKKGKITLKADNKDLDEIRVSDTDNLCIIGKIFKIK
ncbi:MAG: LexA family transcriptional regulator [Clostridia bacterium]|nr:LexA family transcriptional regulator [Clostridia bacterium]